MNDHKDRYGYYKKRMEIYKKNRKALLQGPEEKLHEMAEELDIYSLRRSVEEDLKKLGAVAEDIYKKIWDGNPQVSDVDKFLSTIDSIMLYEEFISADTLKKWEVAHKLVSAFGETFKKK